MFYVDGADISGLPLRAATLRTFVLELLEEVRSRPRATTPSTAARWAAVVNVITRSGSNEFHGDIMGYTKIASPICWGAPGPLLAGHLLLRISL